jgi:hypothetical protein
MAVNGGPAVLLMRHTQSRSKSKNIFKQWIIDPKVSHNALCNLSRKFGRLCGAYFYYESYD